jgi:uncharacterized protein (DUF2147 family)
MEQVMKRITRVVMATAVLGLVAALAAAAVSSHSVATAPASAAVGRWLTQSGNLEVDIAPCGEVLCGTVVAVHGNRSMEDPRSQMDPADARSPMGMRILSGFAPTGDGRWNGTIYNRENGRTYDCLVTPLAGNKLRVRGYKLVPLIGKDQTWTRVARSAAGAP